MNLLKDKLALITGGGGGLGSAMAQGFAREGARVIVADLDRAKAVEADLKKAGSDAFVWRSDAGEELEALGGK